MVILSKWHIRFLNLFNLTYFSKMIHPDCPYFHVSFLCRLSIISFLCPNYPMSIISFLCPDSPIYPKIHFYAHIYLCVHILQTMQTIHSMDFILSILSPNCPYLQFLCPHSPNCSYFQFHTFSSYSTDVHNYISRVSDLQCSWSHSWSPSTTMWS